MFFIKRYSGPNPTIEIPDSDGEQERQSFLQQEPLSDPEKEEKRLEEFLNKEEESPYFNSELLPEQTVAQLEREEHVTSGIEMDLAIPNMETISNVSSDLSEMENPQENVWGNEQMRKQSCDLQLLADTGFCTLEELEHTKTKRSDGVVTVFKKRKEIENYKLMFSKPLNLVVKHGFMELFTYGTFLLFGYRMDFSKFETTDDIFKKNISQIWDLSLETIDFTNLLFPQSFCPKIDNYIQYILSACSSTCKVLNPQKSNNIESTLAHFQIGTFTNFQSHQVLSNIVTVDFGLSLVFENEKVDLNQLPRKLTRMPNEKFLCCQQSSLQLSMLIVADESENLCLIARNQKQFLKYMAQTKSWVQFDLTKISNSNHIKYVMYTIEP